jgi:hypothetical protein
MNAFYDIKEMLPLEVVAAVGGLGLATCDQELQADQTEKVSLKYLSSG